MLSRVYYTQNLYHYKKNSGANTDQRGFAPHPTRGLNPLDPHLRI